MHWDPNWIIAITGGAGATVAAARWSTKAFDARTQRREDDDDFRCSVRGWPATKDEPARPGIAQRMTGLEVEFSEHLEHHPGPGDPAP